ncbi:hypothetical protein AV530_007735 [Patagioenas fasciata monilis]|uniref:Uncharacterized protein n=1 Tax=Patagioenas fasciata monilis TaxID=372326 RepID=A0A1V4JYW8_PATFA|nr:hypothetical protein AV530_007735 [Patagioenas fasciata monilis]
MDHMKKGARPDAAARQSPFAPPVRRSPLRTAWPRGTSAPSGRTEVLGDLLLPVPTEKRPLSIFLMVWIHSTYFQRDLPTNLGVLEEARRSSLSAVIRTRLCAVYLSC